MICNPRRLISLLASFARVTLLTAMCLNAVACNDKPEASALTVDSNGPLPGALAPGWDSAPHVISGPEFAAVKNNAFGLVFFCGCGRCKEAAFVLAKAQKARTFPAMLFVVAMPPTQAKQFAQQTGIRGTLISDDNDRLAEIYDSTLCPRIWVVDKDGRIAFRSPALLAGTTLQDALLTLENTKTKHS